MNVLARYNDKSALEAIRKLYNKSVQDVEKDIEVLMGWLKKQPHLPKGLQDEVILEKMLIKNKYRIEQTKRKIEAFCTLRQKNKRYIDVMKSIVPSKESVFIFPLPNLTPNLDRVIITGLYNTDIFNFERSVVYTFLLMEMTIALEYSASYIFVFDLKDFNLDIVKQTNFTLFRDAMLMYEEAYSARIRQIHLINCPTVVSTLLNIVKSFLKQKIFDKIVVHSNMESLWAEVPQEVFPKEYGGNEPPMAEIMVFMDDVLNESKSDTYRILSMIADEKLRDKHKCKENDQFGLDGTFKMLNID